MYDSEYDLKKVAEHRMLNIGCLTNDAEKMMLNK
jgi:hypothetical protein